MLRNNKDKENWKVRRKEDKKTLGDKKKRISLFGCSRWIGFTFRLEYFGTYCKASKTYPTSQIIREKQEERKYTKMSKRTGSNTPTVEQLMEMIANLRRQNEEVILRVEEYQRQHEDLWRENEASRHLLEEFVHTLQHNRGRGGGRLKPDKGMNFQPFA